MLTITKLLQNLMIKTLIGRVNKVSVKQQKQKNKIWLAAKTLQKRTWRATAKTRELKVNKCLILSIN
jgi:hypothetical protein